MEGFLVMLKTNLKLVLRDKGYICCLFIIPIMSILLLNIPASEQGSDSLNIDGYKVHELKKDSTKILSMINTKLIIKVYDSSESIYLDYILNELAESGLYHIYRYKSKGMTEDEIKEAALQSANSNTISAVLYIPESLNENILTMRENVTFSLYQVFEDPRLSLLNENINMLSKTLIRLSEISDGNIQTFNELLNKKEADKIKTNHILVYMNDEAYLTAEQAGQTKNIGYNLAVVVIGFSFSGIFIASTIITERHNYVYRRIKLSLSSAVCYGMVKLVITIFTVLIQTAVMGIGIMLFVKTDYGIPLLSYLYFLFGLGLVFNLLSVVIGMIADNPINSNYIAYGFWIITSMLSGLYFSLSGMSKTWKNISLLMPQRWVIKSSEMIMLNEKGAYSIYFLVICGFLAVICSAGLLGLKLDKH